MTHRNAALLTTRRRGLAFALGMALCALLPLEAHATISPMGNVLCGVISIIYGNFGRALATLAVISLGVGAMLGKVSWGLALTVATGISVVFCAPSITSFMLISAGAGQGIGC